MNNVIIPLIVTQFSSASVMLQFMLMFKATKFSVFVTLVQNNNPGWLWAVSYIIYTYVYPFAFLLRSCLFVCPSFSLATAICTVLQSVFHHRTRSTNVKETMVAAVVKANLPISNPTARATDRAPAMIGSVNGLIRLSKTAETFPESSNFH